MGTEVREQACVHLVPQPVQRLTAATVRKPAVVLATAAELLDRVPQRGDALSRQRTRPQYACLPAAPTGMAQHPQRAGDLRFGAQRSVSIEVGFVDHHEIRELHDALLHGLQVIAGVRQLQQQEKIGHAGDGRLGLADADRLDEHDIVARCLADQHRLTRAFSDAAQGPRRRRRTDVRARVGREPIHARLVAEDRAAGESRRRVDREHRDAVAALHEEHAERLDEGRLTDARHTGDADAQRAPGGRQQRIEQGIGAASMVGTRGLEQGDRLGDRASVARTHPRHERSIGSRRSVEDIRGHAPP